MTRPWLSGHFGVLPAGITGETDFSLATKTCIFKVLGQLPLGGGGGGGGGVSFF